METQHAGDFGIEVEGASVDYDGATKHRDKVIKTLTSGVAMLFDKNKIDYIEGFGSVTDDANVKIGGQFDGTEIETDRVILAVGSVPKPILDLKFGKRVLDTAGMWLLNEQPKKLCVIGARRLRHRDRLGLRPARHRGHAARGARPDPAARGRRHREGRRARDQEAERADRDRRQGGERRRLGPGRDARVQRRAGRVRLPGDRRRPRAGRGGPRAGRGRHRARRPRADQGGRAAAHHARRRLGDRRHGPRARAGPQGVRRGHHRRRGRGRSGRCTPSTTTSSRP